MIGAWRAAMTERPRSHARAIRTRARLPDRPPPLLGSPPRRRAALGRALGRAPDGPADRGALLPRRGVVALGDRGAGRRRARARSCCRGPSTSSRITWSRAARAGAGSPAGAPVRIETGDVLVFPHGDAYVMSIGPATRRGPGRRRGPGLHRRRCPPASFPSWSSRAAAARSALHLVCGFLGCDVAAVQPPARHAAPPPARSAAPRRRPSDSLRPARRPRHRGVTGAARRRRVHPAPAERADVRRGGAATSAPRCPASSRDGSRACATPWSAARWLSSTSGRPRRGRCERLAREVGPVALGAGGALRALRRPAADAVPDALADAAGGAPAGRRRRQGLRGGARRRLRSEAAFSRAFKKSGRGAAGRVAPPPRAERDAGTPTPALSDRTHARGRRSAGRRAARRTVRPGPSHTVGRLTRLAGPVLGHIGEHTEAIAALPPALPTRRDGRADACPLDRTPFLMPRQTPRRRPPRYNSRMRRATQVQAPARKARTMFTLSSEQPQRPLRFST